MVKTNRNATPASFGFQYQVNVAIYFMFHYLRDIKYIRVEGEDEDVEVSLTNKKIYMIQAKSKSKDIFNNDGNSTKLHDALLSLAEADSSNVDYLFYASNMTNPLNASTNEFERNDITIKRYNELSSKSQTKIDNQIKKIIKDNNDEEKYNLDKDKLVVIRIPFFGDFDEEKYKFIYEEAKNVMGIMSDTLIGKHKTVVKYCESKFLNNSSTNVKIKITKEEFCNWIILTEVDSMDLSNDNLNIGIEELDYYDAYQKYKAYIDSKVSTYENYSKVYALYNKIKNNQSITISDFVKKEKINLYNYFFEENLTDDSEINNDNKLDVYVSQIISFAILKKNNVISKIAMEANL